MDKTQTRVYLISYLVLLLVFLGIILWMTAPYILSLFLGATLALLMSPLNRWLKEKGAGPVIAATAVTISALALVIIPVTVFLVVSAKQGVSVMQDMPGKKEFFTKTIANTFNRWEITKVLIGDPGQVIEQIQNGLSVAAGYIAKNALKFAKTIPGFILQVCLLLISCFFFLIDGSKLFGWIFSLHTIEKSVQDRLMKTFRETAVTTILASFAAAFCQAIVLFTGFLLLGIPRPFLFGGLSFIFAWLPLIGVTPVWISGMIYLYVHGAITKMIFMFAIGIGVGIIDNIIRAMILKGRAAIHPLIGLVAVIGGIDVFGIMGVIIGPILVAMLISLLKIWPMIGAHQGFAIDCAEPESNRRKHKD